jgi:methylenetetrahydrofolate dehydrogenase (NADP+) / methenyltetrahydrofolate cyclohydrolase
MVHESLHRLEDTKRDAEILAASEVARQVRSEAAEGVAQFQQNYGVKPCLAAIRVGDDAASIVYVQNKLRASEEIGLRSEQHVLPASSSERDLLSLIASMNTRDDIDAILVQLPLPSAIDNQRVINAIDPVKDVDGFHPVNIGLLSLGQPVLVPCTPAGIIELLERNSIEISGAHACIVGRSHVVGRPLAQLFLQRDATVTICHSRTRDLPAITREADILIAAIGRAGFIRGEHIKPGATVIDVGINKLTDENAIRSLFGDESEKRLAVLKKRGFTLVGDVHPAEARSVAGKLTPVPGGVGLLTVAMLMRNTLIAAVRRRKLLEG